ncbi:Sua5/YciO/YrdC/YwlC family protein, partial [uncultured Campylobacter sp.]|uniref:Kae1-like domain-containing protein n=1 Tax=uncultured Campylobacter sp. TaxID=218934 RepID=UPI002638A802
MDCNVKPIVILKKRDFVWRTLTGFAADFGTQNLKAQGKNPISPRFAGEQEETAQERGSALQNLRNFAAQKFSTQSAEDCAEQGELQSAQIFSKTTHRNFACDMLAADDSQYAANELERAYDRSDLQRAAKNLSLPQAKGGLELRHTTNNLNLQSAVDGRDSQCVANGPDFRLATDESISQNSANIQDLRHAEDRVDLQCAACELSPQQTINLQGSCSARACTADARGAHSDSEDYFVRLPVSFSAIFRASAIFIAPSVAPNLNKIGIFLANTGVHLLLFEYFDRPIVATSANISGEPIIFSSEELRANLGSVISFYLDNDREILTPSDDSIAFLPPFEARASAPGSKTAHSSGKISAPLPTYTEIRSSAQNSILTQNSVINYAGAQTPTEPQNFKKNSAAEINSDRETKSIRAAGLANSTSAPNSTNAANLADAAKPTSIANLARYTNFSAEADALDRALFLRTSRGMNPKIFPSKFHAKGTFLALGAELKNQFAIYKDGQIFISPYIGDLKNVATNERFFALLDMFVRAYELKFDAVIADLHPQFSHTRFFEQRGYPVVRYQHHFAHLVSNLAQNDLLGSGKKYLGFCFDGTGYGTDGKIWGGEVMIFNEFGFNRVAKFDEIALIGGENAIKNIYKLALALVFKFNAKDAAREFLAKFSASEVANLEKIAPRAVRSSSLGRLFDAFVAVICGLRTVSFDGEAGMRLENLYIDGCEQSYKFRLKKAGENFTQNAPYSASQQRSADYLRYKTGCEAEQGGLNAQNNSGAKNSCVLRGDFKKLADDAASKDWPERAARNIAGGGEKNANAAANSIKQASALNLINSESKNAAD